MSRIFFVISLFALVVLGCKEKEKRQIELLTKENQSLRHESLSKDSTINEFFQILNEIEANLSLIKEKENVISKNATSGNELQTNARERINQDIQTINELMLKNKRSIQYLSQKLKDSNMKIAEFEKMLAQTNQQLEARDAEIAQLKQKLAELNFSIENLNATVDTLNREKEQLAQTVNKQTETINTAYYAYGTKKELIANKVIDKSGGFLGIGKTSKLKSDFDPTYFTKIDITQTTSVPLFAKKAQVITTHPSDSYKLVTNQDGAIEKLEILDPGKFWSASKYLVVIVE